MSIKTLPNKRLEEQIGYNKYLFNGLKEEAEMLQIKYYSKGKKPSPSQLNKLQKIEKMADYYYKNMKDRIAELKQRRDNGIFIEEFTF